MPAIRRVFPLPLALALAGTLVLGLSAQQPEKAAGAGQPPVKAEIVKHMHGHLAQANDVQHAVVRGDLDEAKTLAGRFAEHKELEGLPDTAKPAVEEMQKAAKEVAQAGDLKAAGQGTAMMVAACGSCHQAMAAQPKFPPTPPPPNPKNPTVAKMYEHQRAVDMLYRGLIGPSDQLWTEGAQALKAAPLKADQFPIDAQVSREALDAQARAHEAAAKAADAKAPHVRAEVYGQLMSECASCHALSGRVLGAGVPKK